MANEEKETGTRREEYMGRPPLPYPFWFAPSLSSLQQETKEIKELPAEEAIMRHVHVKIYKEIRL